MSSRLAAPARNRGNLLSWHSWTGVGILFLACFTLGERFTMELKLPPNQFWIAVSSYDPKVQSTVRPSIGHDEVPFCFEMGHDGNVRLSSSCLKNDHLQKPISHCGFQNLENGTWDQKLMEAPTELLARNIITVAHDFDCQTVLLDIEEITGEAKSKFNPQIAKLISHLRSLDHELSIAVAVYAKNQALGEWDGPAAQNWKLLCSSADEIVIMAYDHTVPGLGEAGETAPLTWVESVLRYAKKSCGAHQIRLGLAAYGYNWQTGAVVSDREYSELRQTRSDAELRAANILVETDRERQSKIKLAHSLGLFKFLIWSKGQMSERALAIFNAG